jgi:hypothetical protein
MILSEASSHVAFLIAWPGLRELMKLATVSVMPDSGVNVI